MYRPAKKVEMEVEDRSTTQKKPRREAGLWFQVASTWRLMLLRYDVGSAGALLALLYAEGDGLPLSQRLETTALNSAVVDKNVLGTVGRGDEAEAFIVAEPLDCTCSHFDYL